MLSGMSLRDLSSCRRVPVFCVREESNALVSYHVVFYAALMLRGCFKYLNFR